MIIDSDWLAQVVELTLGRACDGPTAQALATVLSEPAEVLPWLVLRQGAPDPVSLHHPASLADDPAIMAALAAQAAQIARAPSQAVSSFAVTAPLVAIDRAVCDGLRLLVAEDVARADLAEEVHGLFVRRHAITASGLDQAFRYRIGTAVDR